MRVCSMRLGAPCICDLRHLVFPTLDLMGYIGAHENTRIQHISFRQEGNAMPAGFSSLYTVHFVNFATKTPTNQRDRING